MSQPALVIDMIIQALTAKLAAVNGAPEWRTNIQANGVHPQLKTVAEVATKECPHVAIVPGDFERNPRVSLRIEGTQDIVIWGVMKPDASRMGQTSVRDLTKWLAQDIEKAIEQVPNIPGGCAMWSGTRGTISIDPFGKYGFIEIVASYTTRTSLGA